MRTYSVYFVLFIAAQLVTRMAFAAELPPAQDQDFWNRFGVPALAFLGALIGFFGATFVNDWLDRRRYLQRHNDQSALLALAIRAEVRAMRDQISGALEALEEIDSLPARSGAKHRAVVEMLRPADPIVFAAVADRIGELSIVGGVVIDFYACCDRARHAMDAYMGPLHTEKAVANITLNLKSCVDRANAVDAALFAFASVQFPSIEKHKGL